MADKTEQINIRVSATEFDALKHNADKAKTTVSEYVRSAACRCGEKGYEGIFNQVTWRCAKCGKVNSWKK